MGAGNQLLPYDPNKTVLNFSSISLSPRIRTLLAFGLEFCLPVYKLNFFAYYFKFEKNIPFSVNSFRRCEYIRIQSKTPTHCVKIFIFIFKPYKVFNSIFKRNDITKLKNLATNKDIIICSPDKGRSVVILDRHIYEQKMLQTISDTTKFCAIKEPLITYSLRIEDRINNFLRKLKNLSLMSDDTYKKLFVSGSGPVILYGKPKVHKNNFSTQFQFRPIFAAYKSAFYKISKFLFPILTPFTTNQYTIDNSYSFVKDILKVDNANNFFMTSFDTKTYLLSSFFTKQLKYV